MVFGVIANLQETQVSVRSLDVVEVAFLCEQSRLIEATNVDNIGTLSKLPTDTIHLPEVII